MTSQRVLVANQALSECKTGACTCIRRERQCTKLCTCVNCRNDLPRVANPTNDGVRDRITEKENNGNDNEEDDNETDEAEEGDDEFEDDESDEETINEEHLDIDFINEDYLGKELIPLKQDERDESEWQDYDLLC